MRGCKGFSPQPPLYAPLSPPLLTPHISICETKKYLNLSLSHYSQIYIFFISLTFPLSLTVCLHLFCINNLAVFVYLFLLYQYILSHIHCFSLSLSLCICLSLLLYLSFISHSLCLSRHLSIYLSPYSLFISLNLSHSLLSLSRFTFHGNDKRFFLLFQKVTFIH